MKHSRLLAILVVLVVTMGCSPSLPPPPPAPAETPPAAALAPTKTAPSPAPTPTATAAPSQAEDDSLWQVVFQGQVEQRTTVAGFLDETFGITAGSAGEVHYTRDGGETWPRADNSSLCRFGLEIVDEQLAWHCGNGGHVRVSTDGGRTWQAVADYGPNEPNHCRFLSFLDAKIGWAATPYQLGATTDGGASWADVALPEGIPDIAAITLRTSTDGYLLDVAGNLFVTEDGGESWSPLAPGLIPAGKELLLGSSAPAAAMRFPDANRGLVALSLKSEEGVEIVTVRTADGGQTWEHERALATFGAPYLARDGTILTIVGLSNRITVLRYQGD
jgi:photosystem II stability/assembly factor-like uncharacterized protein